MEPRMDPVIGEMMRSQLQATIGDMGQVLSRNAVSAEIVEQKDFANAIVLDAGEVVLSDNLLQLGAVRDTAAIMQDMFQFTLKPGDVILSNDPYAGGTHVQDFTVLTPFFFRRDQVCYIVCRAHLPDIGGQVPGGYYPFADDVWAEGSRITPLKVIEDGKLVADKLDAVVINSRDPEAFEVSLQAMFAALETARRRLQQIAENYGQHELSRGMQHCLNAAEAQVRTETESWPEAQSESASVLDHDGRGRTDLEVRVRVTTGKKLVIDLTQSAPQSTGFMNSSRANTVGYALAPVVSLLGGTVPTNSGLLRAVDIKTAEGTIVHPRFPAAVGWGPFHVGAEIVSAVAQALARIFPGKIAVLAPKFMMLLARWPQQGITLPLHTLMQGGAAGTRGVDGWGVPGPFSRATMPSIEMVESHTPLMLRRLELLPDSAGMGQWRGGFGTIAEFQFHGTSLLDAIIEGQAHPSESVAGGHAGAPNSIEIGGVGTVNGLAWDKEVSGKVLTVRMGGGAGWGDAAARDPMLTREDVANELTTAPAVPANPAPGLQTAGQQRQL